VSESTSFHNTHPTDCTIGQAVESHTTDMPRGRKSGSKIKQARKWLSGAAPGTLVREDSDDELGYDDLPWQWIYGNDLDNNVSKTSGLKKRKLSGDKPEIVGARMGKFQCNLGDAVLLKAADNEVFVGLICEFGENDEGEKNAYFMWFSSPAEIRNKAKKRTDSLSVRRTFI
jgi:origin recognition complex subunit 1